MRTLGLPPFPGHKANLTMSEQNLSKVNHIEEISGNIGQNLSRAESHRRNRAYHKQPFQNLIKRKNISRVLFTIPTLVKFMCEGASPPRNQQKVSKPRILLCQYPEDPPQPNQASPQPVDDSLHQLLAQTPLAKALRAAAASP